MAAWGEVACENRGLGEAPSTPRPRSAACWGFLWRWGTLVRIQGTAESPRSPPPAEHTTEETRAGRRTLDATVEQKRPQDHRPDFGFVPDLAVQLRKILKATQEGTVFRPLPSYQSIKRTKYDFVKSLIIVP